MSQHLNPRKRYYIVVSGRVQGVGFRYFVVQKAADCQLAGWVKNLPNGKVEIEAEGEEKDLYCFIDYLKLGNGFSRTDQLQKSELPTLANYSNFKIHY